MCGCFTLIEYRGGWSHDPLHGNDRDQPKQCSAPDDSEEQQEETDRSQKHCWYKNMGHNEKLREYGVQRGQDSTVSYRSKQGEVWVTDRNEIQNRDCQIQSDQNEPKAESCGI